MLTVATVLTVAPAYAEDDAPRTLETRRAAAKAKLEKAFEKRMTNVVLVGRFSITEGDEEKPSKKDRYQVDKVTKLQNDVWLFHYRRSPDLVFPIPMKIRWAGDTPMILMTNEKIPGMGTFTARVFFYENRYAGTWQHGAVGGHMWGLIRKGKQAPAKSEKPKTKKESK
jgi:hypothetical protein